jgi:DNA repair exonuclease SbcCD ATPase subunit
MQPKNQSKNIREIGLVGILTLLGQLGIGFHSNYNVSDEIKKLTSEIQEIRLEQEKYYVRKYQLRDISIKLDKIEERINSLTVSVSSIKVKLRSINQSLSAQSCEPNQAFNLVNKENLWN